MQAAPETPLEAFQVQPSTPPEAFAAHAAAVQAAVAAQWEAARLLAPPAPSGLAPPGAWHLAWGASPQECTGQSEILARQRQVQVANPDSEDSSQDEFQWSPDSDDALVQHAPDDDERQAVSDDTETDVEPVIQQRRQSRLQVQRERRRAVVAQAPRPLTAEEARARARRELKALRQGLPQLVRKSVDDRDPRAIEAWSTDLAQRMRYGKFGKPCEAQRDVLSVLTDTVSSPNSCVEERQVFFYAVNELARHFASDSDFLEGAYSFLKALIGILRTERERAVYTKFLDPPHEQLRSGKGPFLFLFLAGEAEWQEKLRKLARSMNAPAARSVPAASTPPKLPLQEPEQPARQKRVLPRPLQPRPPGPPPGVEETPPPRKRRPLPKPLPKPPVQQAAVGSLG